jgi:putative phosphoribosyl transferase
MRNESKVTNRLKSREQAGQLLGEKLASYSGRSDVLVLGLPRGGISVAYEVAKLLMAPLDVLLVRKLRVPGFEDFSMGTISIGTAASINQDIVEEFGLSQIDIEKVIVAERREIERLNNVYREHRLPLDLRNQTAILVDDGMATGATMRAAIMAARQLGANQVVSAVGVAPLSTFLLLEPEADEVVCLLTPREVRATHLFYEAFPVITERDVKTLLNPVHGTASA